MQVTKTKQILQIQLSACNLGHQKQEVGYMPNDDIMTALTYLDETTLKKLYIARLQVQAKPIHVLAHINSAHTIQTAPLTGIF